MDPADDLTGRVRIRMSHFEDMTERTVMNGTGFFLGGRMAVAVLDDTLCLQVDETRGDPALTAPAARPFEFAGRTVHGWVSIPEESLDDASLTAWVGQGVANLGLSM